MTLSEHLHLIYGPDVGGRAAVELDRLIDGFRPRLARLRTAPGDGAANQALLITYGDSLQRPGAAPLAVLREFATRHLENRLSGIHLLPFFPYSSDYGFAVRDYLAVREDLGGWPDVEALHRDFRLMFDLVLNHVSAQGDWFQGFLAGQAPYRDYFITVDPATDLSRVTRPRTTPLLTPFDTALGRRWVWTTFGPDQVDLNYRNPEVLLRMLEVLLTYVERGADLLRMDAVAYLWKEPGTSCVHLPQTHQLVKLFRAVLDEVAPRVAIVTETNVPHRDNVGYFGDGRDEAQMVYQFPLAPLVLDALARGDGDRLAKWVSGLETPSDRTTFFNFLASHDGIGVVPARGLLSEAEVGALAERVVAHGGQVSDRANPDGSASPYELNATFFDALSDPADATEPEATKIDRFICSQAIMLALAGVPGVYLHSLFGSSNDQAGFERSGWKRDLNHQRLQLSELEARLADPATRAAQVFARYARLLEIHHRHPAFHPHSGQRVLDLGSGILALARGPRDGRLVVALHNLTDAIQVAGDWSLDQVAEWEDLLGGERFAAGAALRLAPYRFAWLEGVRVLDHVSLPLSFAAGLVSFLSPCVLPLVPAYLAYLGGRAGGEEPPERSRLLLAGAAFVVGLTLVFVLFFYAFQALLTPLLPILAPVAGVLVILLALQLVGILRFGFLQREFRVMKTAPGSGGVAGGLLLGLGFATGWTPCVGPTLGAILTSGFQEGATGQGLLLILVYSLGLGLPFLVLAAGFEWAAPAVRTLNRRRRVIDIASAGILTVMGLLLLTNHLSWVTLQVTQLLPGWVSQGVAL